LGSVSPRFCKEQKRAGKGGGAAFFVRRQNKRRVVDARDYHYKTEMQ